MTKIWEGRVKGNTNILADNFTFSLATDLQLYEYDIIGNIAYSAALKKLGIISEEELKKIINGLIKVKDFIEKNEFNGYEYEDIHSLIEYELKKEIGEIAGKIHTGRSRNDQIVLDEKLYLKNVIIDVIQSLLNLEIVLIEFAKKNFNIIFPAYTHLQKAQPVLFSHYILSYFEKFYRDINKLLVNFEECDYLPLGSAACTGSGYDINRDYLMKLLKFKNKAANSMDEVSNRDYFQDFIYSLSCIMIHLSRFCEDLIIYNTGEFSFIEIADEFCTGSSIMPQKKNPDILELIRGKSSLVVGNLMQLLMLQKSLPSTYNRDLQEDKKITFNAFEQTISSIQIFKEILKNIKLKPKNINKAIKNQFLEATDVADYLVKKGETFRKAHNITGKIINYCINNKINLNKLNITQLKKFSELFEEDFFKKITLAECINSKITDCGTNKNNVRNKLKRANLIANNIKIKIKKLKDRVPEINYLIQEINNEMD